MILGMSLAAFTQAHVVISLIAIVTGLVVVAALLRNRASAALTGVFLATTILTSVTGLMFPNTTLTPGQIFGYLSLAALAVAVLALYALKLRGVWRTVFVTAAVVALYLNVFVGVAQLFQKVPALARLAPTQAEAPFLGAQLVVLVLFVGIGIAAARRFRHA